MSVQLDCIANFRDVGRTINNFLGQRRLREGLLYRSARPDDATMEDRRVLVEDLGVKSVIDLRTKTEHYNQAQKRQALVANAPAILESNATLAEPVQIRGLQYHEVRITGGQFEKFMVSQTSWWGFFTMLTYFLFGYRTEGIQVLSREVMNPRGLVRMGLDTLDQSGPLIATALRAMIEPSGLPLIVHCTVGKDRTGLVIALVLLTLGIPREAIEYDYALTDAGIESQRADMLADLKRYGLDDTWASTAPDMIAAMEAHLRDEYGGLDAYLDGTGFGQTERTRLREMLLC